MAARAGPTPLTYVSGVLKSMSGRNGWGRTSACACNASVQCKFMPNLLAGKLALVTGIANRWSLAYAVAQAYSREGATLVLTHLGETQKEAITDLCKDLDVAAIL